MNQHPPFRLFTAETPSTRETEQRFRLHRGVCNLTKAGGPKVTTPLKPPTEGLVRSLAVGVAGRPESLRAARGLSPGPGPPHQARHPAGHRADQNVKVASRSGADEGRPGPRGTPVTAAGPRGAPAGPRQPGARAGGRGHQALPRRRLLQRPRKRSCSASSQSPAWRPPCPVLRTPHTQRGVLPSHQGRHKATGRDSRATAAAFHRPRWPGCAAPGLVRQWTPPRRARNPRHRRRCVCSLVTVCCVPICYERYNKHQS